MGTRRNGGSSSSSGTSSSSSSDSSSSSHTSSSTAPSAVRRRQAAVKPLARKRQRSPSPQVKTDRERGHSPRQHDRHAKQDGHRTRRSASPSRRRRSPAQEPSRNKRHTDERESSRPSSRRDADPHSSSRHRAADSHKERSQRARPDRSPGSRHGGRDHEHDSKRAGKETVQAKTERSQRDDRAANDHKRSSRHKDRELLPDPRQDVPRSSRRPPRPDNPGAARDQTDLPPPPSQPLPGPPEGNARRQGPAANGGQRQNRWAKADTQGKEQWGKPDEADGKKGKEEKPEPEANFALSGKLAAESNTVNGVVLVHQEPPESRQPSQMWRLYGFKNGEPIDKPLYIHRQSCYLFGRERRVADVPLDHPSISKQHAILQYRLTEKEGADNMMHSAVRPYLMDLGSANGTYLNNERIEGERYYELLERDMIKFGHSTREYVLLHAQSNA